MTEMGSWTNWLLAVFGMAVVLLAAVVLLGGVVVAAWTLLALGR